MASSVHHVAMSPLLLTVVALVVAGFSTPVSAADILLVPFAHGFNSRLMNMQKMADLLMDAGHHASILINSAVAKSMSNERATWHVYKVPKNVSLQTSGDKEFIKLMMYGPQELGPWGMVQAWIDFEMPLCEALLGGEMLPHLKAHNFDLLLIDIGDDCSRIIVDYLDIPTILYSNYGFNYDTNVFYPQPWTFVCAPDIPDVCTSDDMTFEERMGNFIAHVIMEFFTTPYLFKQYDELRQKFGYNVTLPSIKSLNRHVIIANADFAIDFPRPIMPHIITISGIFRKDPKPLLSDLQQFFASSGDHGVILLSFGTLISALDDAKAEIVARVFARLPQKVLWRHSGSTPKNLGTNTKLMKWIPQNDILAHPKLVLFVTHCGIASTFEAALHGVPVVTVPLFVDQHLNSARLVNRAKMGVRVNIRTFNEVDFAWAINHVVNTTSYRDNAKRTARLMNDSPNTPSEVFLYWIGYVIRHNGAHHLQSGPARRMSLIQYLGIDVLAIIFGALIGGGALVVFVLYCVLRFTCRKLSRENVKIKVN